MNKVYKTLFAALFFATTVHAAACSDSTSEKQNEATAANDADIKLPSGFTAVKLAETSAVRGIL